MTQPEARELFDKLALELNLPKGWYLVFDNAKRRFGQCRYSRRQISLSAPIVALNDAKHVEATIRHEIAHALVGPGHGHDEVWRAMAIKCGDDGERCYDPNVETPPAAWSAKCSRCGLEYKRHRALKPGRMLWCGKCPRNFKPELALSFAPNPAVISEAPKMTTTDPQVLEVLRLRSTGMGYVAIDAKFGVFGKKGWWSWKIVKTFKEA